jgi:septation ring formation regulator EzrA
MSEAEAQLSKEEIAEAKKQISSIEDKIKETEEQYKGIKGLLNKVDDPEWQERELGIKYEPSKRIN